MESSRFFTPVTAEGEDSNLPPKVIVTWDEKQLEAAKVEIDLEIKKVRLGLSDHCSQAVDNGAHGFPAENAIKIFFLDPSDHHLNEVVQVTGQDLGHRMGTYFGKLIKRARRVDNVKE